MLWGILASAGLFGLLDSALRLGLPDGGLWRETAIVVLAGDLGLALALGSIGWLLVRAAPGLRARLGVGFGVGLGLGIGAAPFVGSLLPVEPVGLLTLPAGALLGLLLQAVRTPRPGLAWILALPAPMVLGVAVLLPPTDIYFDQPPALPAAEAVPAPPSAAVPDVLLVSVDTLRADRVLALADQLPNLTALRRRGTWADYGLSSTNQTVPAHVSLLSGLSALEHGVRHNHDIMGPGVPMIAEELQAAGWNTAGVISNGLLRGVMGFGRGFDAFDDSEVAATGRKLAFRRVVDKNTWIGWICPSRLLFNHLVPWLLPPDQDSPGPSGAGRRTTDSALRFQRQLRERPEPYFLFVHYLDPHHPYRPPEQTAGMFFQLEDLPPEYRGGPLADNKMMFRLREELVGDDAATRERALAASRALMPLYDEEIVFIDQMLGELLAAVEAGGRPTVVIFTSDHGEHFGEHGLLLHSCSLYEELVRVPFVLAGPGIPARRLDFPPHLEDVVPTLRSLAGFEADPGLRGRDLSAASLSHQPHLERYQRWISVRDGRWKLIVQFSGDQVEPRELYDVVADPLEQRDRLVDEPEVAARLADRARAELAAAESFDRGTRAVDPDVQAALLEELGYVDGDH